MLLSRFVVGMLSVGLMVLDAGVVCGQDFPNKTIRIVVSTPGGSSDFAARLVAQGISGPLGQPVVVEYRGSGILSAEVVHKAPPDGYTLLLTAAGLWIFPLLQKAPYDAVRDFAPISQIVRTVNIVAVHPSLPVKTVKELIALAKARPGALNYASAATGGSAHLAMELFKHKAGVNIMRIAYKGGPTALRDLLSGEVQMIIDDATSAMPTVKSGKLRALAVTSAEPSALVPGLPTVAASGLPGYEAVLMTGIWAPAKTPGTIINRLNQEIVRGLNLPDVKEKFFNALVEVVGSSAEQFAATIKSEIVTMGKVIKDAGIKLD